MDQELFDACFRKSNNIDDISWDDLARKFGYGNGEILRNRFKREKKKERLLPLEKEDNNSEEIQYRQSEEIKSDGTVISDKLIKICESESKTPKSLLIAHGFDPDKFDLVSSRSNMWHMPKKDGNKLVCLQSRIVCVPKTKPEISLELIEKVFESLKIKDLSPLKINSSKYVEDGYCLIIPIMDFHLGLQATQPTTSNIYNLEVAENRLLNTISQIKEQTVGRNISEIVLTLGNDFFNTDNLSNTTTSGTPQDSVASWFEIFDKGLELIIKITNTLLEIAPVRILNIVSNHDTQSMFAAMKAVDYYYKDNDNCLVDISQLYRKYYKFGKVLFGFAHDIPIKSALSLMTTEAKKDWSECNNYYFILAHLHKSMKYAPEGDIQVMRCPTMSGFSRWSASKGYINADIKTEVFIVDKNKGILEFINIFV